MKIIRDLAEASVESGKKDTLAIQISIVLAVVILGTVVFIVDSLNRDKYNYIVSTVGNYHVSLSEVDETIYDTLIEDKDIEKISFDRVIHTNFQADIYEKGDDGSHLNGYKITAGRKPAEADELMVPERFLSRHRDFKLGSEITVDDQTYTVVGVYDDYNYSFEDSALIGCLKDTSKEALFKDRAGLTASIWYKNPRDTYTLTRDLLSDLGIDEKKAESTGRLYYNTDVLEYNLIYPSGIIPPKSVLSEALEKYSLCFFLTLLFAVMIYGAFNVWNNRTLKEIALLKSAGMTEKQVKTMVRLKSLHLARVPIILGTVLSYLAANLLLYLMWLNNSISYSKLSNIFGDDMLGPSFHIIHPSVGAVLLTLLLSLLTVYLSAIVPAKKVVD
ncbi:MAG: ABC transporter permease [Peptoniphilus sp.]|nr:ABC transporter permease [Peptoniphilus sp.]MDY6045384.1 ABC transporter permease [Peptoniphilus sp.]